MGFTDDPLIASSTPIKAIHVTEVRDAVNAARTAAGLEPQTFTDGSLAGIAVRAVHITELRTSLETVRSHHTLPPFLYTDPLLNAGTSIKAVHVQELREVSRRLVDGCPPISVANPAQTNFTVNTAITAAFTQSGSVDGVTFSVAAGTLPDGVTLAASGGLAGTPTETGSFPIIVTAADRYGCSGSGATYTLSVVPPPIISSFTGPTGPVTPGATVTLVGTFSGGGGLITSDQGHSFVAASGTEYQLTATADTVYTLTITNAAGDQVAASLTVVVVDVSGRYAITPRITYSCAFGFVNLNISTFTFTAAGSSLTVTGAPVAMTGEMADNSFDVTGIVVGSVTQTYSLTGQFDSTLTTWTGTFRATFVGTGTLDCTNQAFNVAGARPFQLVGATATSATTVVLQFSNTVDASTVLADGSQATFNESLSATFASADANTVIVITTTQAAGQIYTVTLATTIRDTNGTAVSTSGNVAMFPGWSP